MNDANYGNADEQPLLIRVSSAFVFASVAGWSAYLVWTLAALAQQ
jgi:hypothetical protein